MYALLRVPSPIVLKRALPLRAVPPVNKAWTTTYCCTALISADCEGDKHRPPPFYRR